jgi:hypothetical protein
MSDTTSATGTGASTPTTTDEAVATAVAQVKESRAKEAKLRGNPELAKVFLKEKAAPVAETGEAVAEVAADGVVTAQAAEDPAAKALAERRARRTAELAELARTGREKWQQSQAEKRERSELAKARADIEAERKQIAAEKERIALADKDPFKYLETRGVPPEELAKRVLRRGDPAAQAEELRAELESYKKSETERREQEEKSRKEQAEQFQRQQQALTQRQAEAAFVRMASDEAKYPALTALFTPQEILIKAQQVISEARAANPNVFYDDEEIADFLEKEAQPRLAKVRGVAASAAAKPGVKIPLDAVLSPGGVKAVAPPARPTLSSDLQSELQVDSAAWKKLPKSKQNKILGERLQASLARK